MQTDTMTTAFDDDDDQQDDMITPQPPTAPLPPSVAATAPGQLKVIKRNGTVVPYTDDKIAVAMTKAFLAVEGGSAAASPRIRELVAELAGQVSATFRRRFPSGGTIHIEDIQDQVELALMRSGEHKVARDYVLYREERARIRAEARAAQKAAVAPESSIQVVAEDGSRGPLDVARIRVLVQEACGDLTDVDGERIIREAMNNMYDGISQQDVSTALLIAARTLVEEEPNYTYVTARLLLDQLRSEALRFLDVNADNHFLATQTEMTSVYAEAFKAFIGRGIELELVAPELAAFDLDELGAALKPERDLQFTYLGLQTLYDRYFIHSDGVRFELPQVFFMRVAMGLADAAKTARTPAPSSSTTCCRRSTTCRRRRRCSTPAPCARSCRRASSPPCPTTSTASTAPSATTPCCRSGPAASATTGPRCARWAPTSKAPTANRRASCRS
jgi:ribonucleoside-diphosphate reductase alpha chain